MNDHSPGSDHSNPIAINDLAALNLAASSREVHLWHADLDSFSSELLDPVLSAEELARAGRFHFVKDKKHFIVARALLRKLLAAYLGSDPQLLTFEYGDKGKPFVAAGGQGRISFNLAHSGGRAIYVFTKGREVGVDLEFIRKDTAGADIAKRFFSAWEMQAIQTVPEEQRKEAFFNCWTRKEAYIKARGEGLSIPLDSFDVSVAPEETAALLRNYVDEAEVARWEMQAMPVAQGFVAALVVEGKGWQLKTFQITP